MINFDIDNVNVSSNENKDMNIQDKISALEAEIAAADARIANANAQIAAANQRASEIAPVPPKQRQRF